MSSHFFSARRCRIGRKLILLLVSKAYYCTIAVGVAVVAQKEQGQHTADEEEILKQK
jgi:hypothetical protein